MTIKTELWVLRVLVIGLSLLMLASPARADWEAAPYAAGAMDYQINEWSSNYVRTDCKAYFKDIKNICRGTNPLGEIQLGFEFAHESWRTKWYVPVFRAGWRHRSHVFDGFPFNNNPEVTTESVFLELKLGGLK